MWKDPRSGRIYRKLPNGRYLRNGLSVDMLVRVEDIENRRIREVVPKVEEPKYIKQVVTEENLQQIRKRKPKKKAV